MLLLLSDISYVLPIIIISDTMYLIRFLQNILFIGEQVLAGIKPINLDREEIYVFYSAIILGRLQEVCLKWI